MKGRMKYSKDLTCMYCISLCARKEQTCRRADLPDLPSDTACFVARGATVTSSPLSSVAGAGAKVDTASRCEEVRYSVSYHGAGFAPLHPSPAPPSLAAAAPAVCGSSH